MSLPLVEFLTLKADQRTALRHLGLITIKDFLYYFPKKYNESSEAVQIQTVLDSSVENSNIDADKSVTPESIIFGQIRNLKTGRTFKSKLPMATATLTDDSGSVKLMWIRQPYIAKMIQEGSLVKVSGKPSEKNGVVTFINPRIESVGNIPNHIGQPLFESADSPESRESVSCTPTYAETKGLTSLWFYHAFKKIAADPRFGDGIVDPLPEDMRKRYNLPSLQTALIWIHAPQKESDAMVARKRFAFEEIFFIQLRAQIERAKSEREKSFVIDDKKNVDAFIDRLGFTMTEGQLSAVGDILGDMKRGYPMSRLLEGDVGSGKTAVAASATYAVVTERPKNQKYGTLQVAYMAPTEILAKQHFESFIQLFKHMPISMALITGKECRKFPSKLAGTSLAPHGWTHISRSQLTKWVKNGEISIVIGTHALIQKNVAFKHLGLVIIDEQHRFGTNQRQRLARKHDITPHLLSMTATPIPRTLALTLYGDLDLSIIEQMPSGRKPIITKIIKPEEQAAAYEHIRQLVREGRQAYIICPRIDEPDQEAVIPLYKSALQTAPDAKQMKSVIGEAKRLNKEVFSEFKFGILHSRMKPALKEEVMRKFLDKEIDILVATSVVEVGVNVPNATVILIEHADRYGLSQLHQLRGRVIRGNHQAYCYLATSTAVDKSVARLKAIQSAKNGFELAELDMKMRGTGELYGAKQWGVSDIAMDAIQNLKMVEAARKEAREVVAEDLTLGAYPLLQRQLAEQDEIHFE
jgi:ATP-dependent DNA helicase RecG